MASSVTRRVKPAYQGKRKIKSSYKRPKDLKRGSSSTPGKLKGDNCKKTPGKIRYAKDSRFIRTDPQSYQRVWDEEIEKLYKKST